MRFPLKIKKPVSLRRRVTGLQKDVSALKASVATLEKSIATLQKSLDASQKLSRHTSTTLSKLNDSIAKGVYLKSDYFEVSSELGVFTVRKFRDYFRGHAETLEAMLERLKKDTDEKSHEAVDIFVRRVMEFLPEALPGDAPVLYSMRDLFTEDEIYPYASGEAAQKTREFRRRYTVGNLKTFLCPVYYESGLVFVDDAVRSRIAGGTVIDCGAYWGDSALIFCQYGPAKVFAFEPVERWFNEMSRIIDDNNLGEVIEPVKLGVSDQAGSALIKEGDTTSALTEDAGGTPIELTTIDDFMATHPGPVALIKYDVEGADFHALRGSEGTIRAHRPILLTSIYHTPEHFFEIKDYIDSLGLGYRHKIRKLAKSPLVDLMLISWVD